MRHITKIIHPGNLAPEIYSPQRMRICVRTAEGWGLLNRSYRVHEMNFIHARKQGHFLSQFLLCAEKLKFV